MLQVPSGSLRTVRNVCHPDVNRTCNSTSFPASGSGRPLTRPLKVTESPFSTRFGLTVKVEAALTSRVAVSSTGRIVAVPG